MLNSILRRNLGSILRRFIGDERGAILVYFTATVLLLIGIVAIAIDFGQAAVLKQKLRNAADAAALAVGSRPDLTSAQATAKAEAFIRANYPDLAIGDLTSFTVTPKTDKVDVSVTARLDTILLGAFGVNTVDVAVSSTVVRTLRKLEVVLVIDNTGSMCDPCSERLDKVKVASQSLVTTLFGTSTTSEYVRIALVPFSAAVNLGSGALGRGWIDEVGASALNSEDITLPKDRPSLFQLYQDMSGVSWGGCVRARTDGFDLLDTPPNPSDVRTYFTPYFAPDETSRHPNNYIAGDEAGTSRSPDRYKGSALSADDVRLGRGPSHNCVPQPIQPLTNSRTSIESAIRNMWTRGSTVIPEGLAWGWRVVSPGQPYSEGASYSDQNVIKAVVLLTDGQNQVDRTPAPFNSYYSAYGHARSGHIGATDGSTTRPALNAKTAALCTNIKADKDGSPTDEDILLYTIAFKIRTGSAAIDAETRSLLQSCATPADKCPGNQCYFDSPSGDDIEEIFKKIALGLSELRVSK